jgi:hypothetical protein
VLTRRGKLFISAPEQHVDALTYFSLNQTAAAGGGLKFKGDALVSGTQVAQFVDSIQVNLCAGRYIDEFGYDIIDPDEKWILCKPAQFRQGLA